MFATLPGHDNILYCLLQHSAMELTHCSVQINLTLIQRKSVNSGRGLQ